MHLIKPLIEILTFKEILIILKKFWLNNMDNLNLTLQVFNTATRLYGKRISLYLNNRAAV